MVIAIYYLIELPETSKGVGFTKDTLNRAQSLVVDDEFELVCLVAKFVCPGNMVEITGTVNYERVVYRQDSPGADWKV